MTIYTPYWWEEAPRPQQPKLSVNKHCDAVIIGSGYAGLSASIELARAGRSVQLFDKSEVGSAASSRSGGIASGNLRISLSKMIASYGLKKAKAYYWEGIQARSDLRQFIQDEKIHCHYQTVGRYTAAATANHYESLAKETEHLNKHFSLDAAVITKSEQHLELGTDAYYGGVVRPDIHGLHPALLHQGMLDKAIAAGVTIHAKTAVTAITRNNGSFQVTTARGTVNTRDVVVCTNGYTDKAIPWLRRRIVPVPSLIVCTDPIPSELMDRLFPRYRMCGDTNQLHHYFRPTPDRTRILFGGRAQGRLNADKHADQLVPHSEIQREMIRVFPELNHVGLSHVWWGYVAMNVDQLPQITQHNGIHYVAGFCGSGVVWARWFGRKAAQRILGDPKGVSVFDNQPFRAIPFYNGNPWFLPAAESWYRFKDRFGK